MDARMGQKSAGIRDTQCGLESGDDAQLGMSGFVEHASHFVELLESLQLGNDDAGEARGEPPRLCHLETRRKPRR